MKWKSQSAFHVYEESMRLKNYAENVKHGAKHSAPGSEIFEKLQFRKLADISISWYEFELETSKNK